MSALADAPVEPSRAARARLFVALELPTAVKDHLAGVIESVRAAHPADARWVPRDNLHLTLVFLGWVEEERISEVSSAVAGSVSGLVDFTTHLDTLGAFPSERRARVVWVGLDDAAGGLATLAQVVAEGLSSIGFPREDRPFRAHVTLARLRAPNPVRLTGAVLDRTRFSVQRVTLFRSHLGRPAPRYESLATFPFHRELTPPREGD